MRLSREHYINKQRISEGKINKITKLSEIWMKLHHIPYMKVLIHVGTEQYSEQ